MPFATNQGTQIYYEVTGAGPPLLLFHGLTGSGVRWRDTGYVAGLQDHYQIILIDARGHGQSDKPPSSTGLRPRGAGGRRHRRAR